MAQKTKDMKFTKDEVWHLSMIMEERGTMHCEFCISLKEKVDKYLEKFEHDNTI